MGKSRRWAPFLAWLFFATSVVLAISLGLVWTYATRALNREIALLPPILPLPATSVSPLLLHYQLDLPGRGEIFPNLIAAKASDYWPVGILTIANTSDKPVIQNISAQVDGWSYPSRQTFVIAPRETRKLRLSPELMPQAGQNTEIQKAILRVDVIDAEGSSMYSQVRPVFLHSA